jgi:hypothetical protein
MYAPVSNKPDPARSATTTLPWIVVADAIFTAEEFVSLLPHHGVIDPRQPLVTLHKLLGRYSSRRL